MEQVLSDPVLMPSPRCDVAGDCSFSLRRLWWPNLKCPNGCPFDNSMEGCPVAGLFVGTVVNVEVDCQTALSQPLQRPVRQTDTFIAFFHEQAAEDV